MSAHTTCSVKVVKTKQKHYTFWLFVRGHVLENDNDLKLPYGIYDPFLIYGTKGAPL